MQLTLTQRSSCRVCCSIVSQRICFTHPLDQRRRIAAGALPSERDIFGLTPKERAPTPELGGHRLNGGFHGRAVMTDGL